MRASSASAEARAEDRSADPMVPRSTTVIGQRASTRSVRPAAEGRSERRARRVGERQRGARADRGGTAGRPASSPQSGLLWNWLLSASSAPRPAPRPPSGRDSPRETRRRRRSCGRTAPGRPSSASARRRPGRSAAARRSPPAGPPSLRRPAATALGVAVGDASLPRSPEIPTMTTCRAGAASPWPSLRPGRWPPEPRPAPERAGAQRRPPRTRPHLRRPTVSGGKPVRGPNEPGAPRHDRARPG